MLQIHNPNKLALKKGNQEIVNLIRTGISVEVKDSVYVIFPVSDLYIDEFENESLSDWNGLAWSSIGYFPFRVENSDTFLNVELEKIYINPNDSAEVELSFYQPPELIFWLERSSAKLISMNLFNSPLEQVKAFLGVEKDKTLFNYSFIGRPRKVWSQVMTFIFSSLIILIPWSLVIGISNDAYYMLQNGEEINSFLKPLALFYALIDEPSWLKGIIVALPPSLYFVLKLDAFLKSKRKAELLAKFIK